MRWQETGGIGPCVLVGLAPLEALGRDPVRCQRATTWGETTRDDHSLVSKPLFVVSQHPCVEGHILWAQMWLLIGLCVNPAQRLKITQMVMVRQLLWQCD